MASLLTVSDNFKQMTVTETDDSESRKKKNINYNTERIKRDEFDDTIKTIELFNNDINVIVDHFKQEYKLPDNLEDQPNQFKYKKEKKLYSLDDIADRLLYSINNKENVFNFLPFNYSFNGIVIDQKNFSSCENIKNSDECNNQESCYYHRNKCKDGRTFLKSGINLLDNHEFQYKPLKVESYYTGSFNPVKGGINLNVNPWDNAVKELKEELLIDIQIYSGEKQFILNKILELFEKIKVKSNSAKASQSSNKKSYSGKSKTRSNQSSDRKSYSGKAKATQSSYKKSYNAKAKSTQSSYKKSYRGKSKTSQSTHEKSYSGKKSYKGKAKASQSKYNKPTGRPLRIETLEIEENITFKLQIGDRVFYGKLERLVYMYTKKILLFDIRTNTNIEKILKPLIAEKYNDTFSTEITGIKNKYLKYKKKYLLLKQYIKNRK